MAAKKLIDKAISIVHNQTNNFQSVRKNWFQDAETIATNNGSEITISEKSKHQSWANTLADTAR